MPSMFLRTSLVELYLGLSSGQTSGVFWTYRSGGFRLSRPLKLDLRLYLFIGG